MVLTDQQWDKRLGIKTCGRVDFASDHFKYPYEPTPYGVLEVLTKSGLVGPANTVLDYGSGKGRVGFFLSQQTGCASLGVEYNALTLEDAQRNLETAPSRNRVTFVGGNAEQFTVPAEIDRCFFFNPFSGKTLAKVLSRIMDSYWEHPRRLLLFFYYPSDDFLACLAANDQLTHLMDLDCSRLFDGDNPRERIAVYELAYGSKDRYNKQVANHSWLQSNRK